eukprot:905535-Pyramimonas_sp.AAC.1
MDPQLYQALKASSPIAFPRAVAGKPAIAEQDSAQRAESPLGRQQWMRRQMREAMESTRRGGIDLPSADSSPPWEYVPDANPSLIILIDMDTYQHSSVIRHSIRRLLRGLLQSLWMRQ